MQTLKSSFLLVGSWPHELKELGAEIVSDLSEAKKSLRHAHFHVLGINITAVLEKRFLEIFNYIRENSPSTQLVVSIPTDYSLRKLIELHTEFQFSKVVQGYQDPQLENSLYSALEISRQKLQDENLVRLMQEQQQKLLNLQADLENRVEKRTRYLTESRRKLFITNTRIEGLKKALISVHQASSLPDIERLLSEALAPSIDISWIRIFFSPQDDLFENQVQEKLDFTVYRVPLYNSHKQIGSIFFMRAPNKSFVKEEIDFLNRVAEAVSLSLDRITKLREIETVKEHWENTFDALSEPVLIIDKDYNVVQANTSARQNPPSTTSLHQQKCFQLLFQRSTPCDNCQRGEKFRIQTDSNISSRFHDVTSQSIYLDENHSSVFVNFYHDSTEKVQLEKQIIESARLAEMGTIGSSIAHELNNPLGGILTFSQLLKMELPKEHRFYDDVVEIEKGAQRCKEIVQNLLGFTRNPTADSQTNLPLPEAIQRALKILELQTKSLGLQINVHSPQDNSAYTIIGHLNLLAQAFKNILQFALEPTKNQPTKNFTHIDIKFYCDAKSLHIEVSNHVPFQKNLALNADLALPIANQILRDHKGQLDFMPDSEGNWMAKISFSRPVLGA